MQGMLYVEYYTAAIICTVISFKDRYEVLVWSLPQDIVGTGNNQVNIRLCHLKLILCYFSL